MPPTPPPATLRVAMRAGHHSARPDSRKTTTTRTRTRTKRLVSTFNPLRGCNSGKALLIGLTRLFCKQQRSSTSTSTSTSTNAEREAPGGEGGPFCYRTRGSLSLPLYLLAQKLGLQL